MVENCNIGRVKSRVWHHGYGDTNTSMITNEYEDTDFVYDRVLLNTVLEIGNTSSDVLICPTLPYGDADFHTEYTGTISIGSDLLEMVMKRISDRLYDCGARHFVFLNGHGGNTHALSKVCRHLYKKGLQNTP